jgi:anti-sigma factor RsiW
MTMHEQWTDQLSDYLDDELAPAERAAVANHLQECAACAAVLNDLKRVVSRAQGLDPRPPRADLWPAVAARIERTAQPRRFSFTLPQLAAAAVLLVAVSGGVVWQLVERSQRGASTSANAAVDGSAERVERGAPQVEREASIPANAPVDGLAERPAVNFADAQYDAAVSDLEKALRAGRGRLDKATIDIVEHNLQIIDQAIAQAREALSADPANTYLSGHLAEARRRKLDLLRRAAALAETD